MGLRPGSKHHNKKTQAEIELRRQKVAIRLLEGQTYQEIGTALEVSKATVSRDVKAILKSWREYYANDANRWLNIVLRRLDTLLSSKWEKAAQGDDRAIDTVLRIMDRQVRLMGLQPGTGTDEANPVFIKMIRVNPPNTADATDDQ